MRIRVSLSLYRNVRAFIVNVYRRRGAFVELNFVIDRAGLYSKRQRRAGENQEMLEVPTERLKRCLIYSIPKSLTSGLFGLLGFARAYQSSRLSMTRSPPGSITGALWPPAWMTALTGRVCAVLFP
jgi:hypothetical protein